jgi:hypothetical protein
MAPQKNEYSLYRLKKATLFIFLSQISPLSRFARLAEHARTGDFCCMIFYSLNVGNISI